jgi:hypothetical protein
MPRGLALWERGARDERRMMRGGSVRAREELELRWRWKLRRTLWAGCLRERIWWIGVSAERVLRSASDARCDSFLECTLTILFLAQTWSEMCRYFYRRRNVGVEWDEAESS